METKKDAAEGGGPTDVLARAERHFDLAIEAFQRMTDRIHAGEEVTQTEAERTARALHAATQTLFTLKMRIADERRRHEGTEDGYAVDLDHARSTVTELLDRLRSDASAKGVS